MQLITQLSDIKLIITAYRLHIFVHPHPIQQIRHIFIEIVHPFCNKPENKSLVDLYEQRNEH